ncbi:hypothetical protein NBRC116594_40180 [Shimia sp. NS0008-38b]|uniref:tetratricopeptide repeat protein n=1 Tax=Shimia sp. NS0008-38b TaxID=3127653 RepID=UPI003107F7AC
MVSATPAPTAAVQIEVAFDYAMAALQAGQPRVAIPVLQSILAEDPKLTRVRLELARAYFLAEQWARSREEFFRVLSGDLPEPVRKTVLAFIRQIDARRGFDWDLSIGLTSAGNKRRYNTERLKTNPLYYGGLPYVDYNRPVENVPALTLSGRMSLRRQLDGLSSENTSVVGFMSLGLNAVEAQRRSYDTQQVISQLGLRLLSRKTTISVGPIAKAQWEAGRHVEDRFGLQVGFERRSLAGGSAYGELNYLIVDNTIGVRPNDPTDYDARDGESLTGTVGYRRSVGGRALIGSDFTYERRDFDRSVVGIEGFHAYKLRVYASIDVSDGWTLSPSLHVRHKDAWGVTPVFVNNPDETAFGGSLRVERSDIFLPGGYTPYAQLDFERNRSGIEAFSYETLGFQIGVERRF